MRPISFQRGYVIHPAGSCLVSFGQTRVLCTASLETSLPPWRRESGLGWLSAEYSMLPGSTGTRKRRDHGKQDGRSVEIQRLIGRSLRACVDFEAMGPASVTIDCDVLQADGGTRTAAITGGYVALVDALRRLAQERGHAGPEAYLRGQLAAVSVGIVEGQVVCDLDYAHDSRAEVDMNVVALGERLVEVQGTGEAGTFDRAQLDQLLDSALAGIVQIQAAQREALAAPLPSA